MKDYKSITNSMRHVRIIDKSILSFQNSITHLLLNKNIKNYAGRNNKGRITVYTKGVRNKRLFRIIDYKRVYYNTPAIVYSTLFDPNRSSFISLIVYNNYICCYILSVHNLNIGSNITNYRSHHKTLQKGDKNKLLYITTGSIIHNLESLPGFGGKYIRSAGTYGKVLKKYLNFNKVLVELPSKCIIYASVYSSATLGIVSNINYNNINIGKAGRHRWLGKKSNVRGVAMNPVDHPHGGGEGKKSAPSFKRSPWGKISKWSSKKKVKKFYLI